jgi:hypothetical protein
MVAPGLAELGAEIETIDTFRTVDGSGGVDVGVGVGVNVGVAVGAGSDPPEPGVAVNVGVGVSVGVGVLVGVAVGSGGFGDAPNTPPRLRRPPVTVLLVSEEVVLTFPRIAVRISFAVAAGNAEA